MKKYEIKKGKHSAKGLNFGITLKREIAFRAKFDESCLYVMDNEDRWDVNKLYGFSTTWHHHRQSARIGWRCLDGEHIQILAYTYFNNERTVTLLGAVKPYEEFFCSIQDTESGYVYHFSKESEPYKIKSHVDDKHWDWWFFHYKLFPYFGGNRTAPHDMHLWIKKV